MPRVDPRLRGDDIVVTLDPCLRADDTVMTRLVWPLPALLAWSAGWSVFFTLRSIDAPIAVAFASAAMPGVLFTLAAATTPWRRVFVGAGFPLSFVAAGFAGTLPAWAWLAPLALLLVLYPLNAWRDAPLFPTPAGALGGLAEAAPLAPGARVLDAGCGLGAGLVELRRVYPEALLFGLEWSWPLRLACGWRCRDAQVSRADIWRASWAAYDLVYLFQRPESMARALAKAEAEMKPGSWLASLEFEAAGVPARHRLEAPGGRSVWIYRMPLSSPTTPRC